MRMRKSGNWSVSLAVIAVAVSLVVGACWAAETVGRPRILGIAYVNFLVSDLDKARAFYGEELGLPTAVVRNGNFVQASYRVNPYQRIELTKASPGTQGSYLLEIGLATDDLMKMRTYLTAKGVGRVDDIYAWPDGTRYFVLADPEGNKIVFIEQKRDSPESGAVGEISHKLIHAGFIVQNEKTENQFYQDVLGFRPYWHGGMKDNETNWMSLQVPDGTDWIEYMLKIPADADKRLRGVMNHISLGVPSVAEAAKELKAKGYTGFEEPKIGRDGKWQLNLYDPDMTRVELMEFTPVEKPCCSEFTGTHPKP